MPNNLWNMETYRNLREDIIFDNVYEAKIMAEIYNPKKL